MAVLEALKDNRLSITFSVAIVHTIINKYMTSYGSKDHTFRVITQLVSAMLSSGIISAQLYPAPTRNSHTPVGVVAI